MMVMKIVRPDHYNLFAEPPSPPRKVAVENVTKTSCTVTWEAPKSDGGSPITGYYLEKSTARASRYVKVSCS